MSGSDDSRPVLDRWLERAFGDEESGRLGSGWLSGTASVFLGGLGLLAVLVLWFPAWLTTPRFRALYPLPAVRALIQVVIATAFVTGCLGMLLRRRKVLGLTGAALALLAALLGGGGVALPDAVDSRPSLGLDWFVLNLFLLALLFVPLERFFPRLPEQGTFRLGWTTDTVHFFMSHLLVQVLSFLILLPAVTVGGIPRPARLPVPCAAGRDRGQRVRSTTE
jgi:hypothetical protein